MALANDRWSSIESRFRGPGRSTSLLGRAEECALLDGLIADVRRGRSRSLVLRGEAGIGKTALVEHLVEAASDLNIVRAVGVESEIELAFASLHLLCAPLLDSLERLPGPQCDALKIVFGLDAGPAPDGLLVGLAALSMFSDVAEQRPLLCVVDDAQWLDHASALTLAFVARRLLAEPLGIVFAAREPGEELQDLPELAVQGLRKPEARELLASAVRFQLDERVRDRIIAETRGNPLALVELPRGLTATELAGGFGLAGAQGLSGQIEERYVRRLDALSADARRLVLVAAADPLGDPLLLRRAAGRLGIAPGAGDDLEADGLLSIGGHVTFRHPLVRSAIYRSATAQDRRAAHRALAEATDREVDPDRRAWHLAAAAAGPDEEVAVELERSAGRAQARGGLAAAAAFLDRAVALTQDPARRSERALTAAQVNMEAGAFDAALELATTAESGPLDRSQRARVDLLRAQIAFASRRGNDAPALLLRAVKQVEPFDARLARAGYFEALAAALFAARLAAPGGGPLDVANAVKGAPSASPPSAADLLLDGWAVLFADGQAAAAPTLREALREFGDVAAGQDQQHLLWLLSLTAPLVWDHARWDQLSSYHLELARRSGALSELPLALASRTFSHLFTGELDTAGALIEESRAVIEATGAGGTLFGALTLAALRGREDDAATALDAAAADATERGEGTGLTIVAWSRALLCNGLAMYDQALAAAREAIECPTNQAAVAWSAVELIEAAVRLGQPEAAAEVAGRFAEIAQVCGTDWALGVHARLRALLSTDATAESLYEEAIERLGRTRLRPELARARLLYGEWLRREQRRVEARAQLRASFDQFTSMGMEAFAERARRELAASGARVRKRTVETRDDLTAQERQIAQMARDGLSNSEIGARLFLSPRTVEWHLHKVFGKLGIRSRLELAGALPVSESEPVPT